MLLCLAMLSAIVRGPQKPLGTERLEIGSISDQTIMVPVSPKSRGVAARYLKDLRHRDAASGYPGVTNRVDRIWMRSPGRSLNAFSFIWLVVQYDHSPAASEMRRRFGPELARRAWRIASEEDGSPIDVRCTFGNRTRVVRRSDLADREELRRLLKAALSGSLSSLPKVMVLAHDDRPTDPKRAVGIPITPSVASQGFMKTFLSTDSGKAL